MSTLENKIETAYATLARQCDAMLADKQVNFYLATLDLNQAAPQEGEAGESASNLKPPYLLLRAKLEDNDLAYVGIHDTPLTVEVGDDMNHASEDGYLDRLFRAAASVFFYKTVTDTTVTPNVTRNLFQALSNSVSGLMCYGMKPDAISTDAETEGSVVKRMITATFICGPAATA